MKNFLRNNGLSLVLAGFFLTFWALQSWAGWRVFNQERQQHGTGALSYGEYLQNGHFWQATGENWESEFLQMAFYVFLTSFLYQRGSAESRDPDRKEPGDDPVSAHADDPGAPAALRKGPFVRFLYAYSLTIALFLLFLISFALHAWGGYCLQRTEAAEHGASHATLGEFLRSPEFWFQSMQNWQSEFLAVLSIVTLSIFLRHHGSPESKRVWDSHHKTGKD